MKLITALYERSFVLVQINGDGADVPLAHIHLDAATARIVASEINRLADLVETPPKEKG